MIDRTSRFLKDFYDLFTSGLTVNEIERLINVDARDTYAFYIRHMKKPAEQQNRVVRFLVFCWNLFLAFLLKLTPARRLFYAIALVGLILALAQSSLTYAFYSFLIINFLLALEVADKLITRDELVLARDIQLSLLPSQIIPPPGYEIAAYSDVAKSVGGDYYDIIKLDDGSTLLVIGDVSGKGISAALYMVKVQTTLQLLTKESSDPRELLIRLNRYLYGQLKKSYFLTVALVQIYPEGRFSYCRAGHTVAILYEHQKGAFVRLQPHGAALGITPSDGESGGTAEEQGAASQPTRPYGDTLDVHSASLEPGDVMLLFTDGVIDTVNTSQQEFGEHRVMDVLMKHHGSSAASIKAALVEAMASFRDVAELRDDTTFVILKRTT